VISSAGPFTGRRTRFTYARRRLLIAALLGATIGFAHAEQRVFELAIHSDAPIAEPAVLAARQNDQVVVRVSSDKPLQVHLHGYDIEKDVVPNVVTPLRFTATATGRFPIEIHSKGPAKHRPVAYLEVRPR
jgi:heme/copper-type cytochrome/quinol oxidase subunit 2